MPELPKWLDKMTDGYNSEGWETRRKPSGASSGKGIFIN
jgi:hypothetical protein